MARSASINGHPSTRPRIVAAVGWFVGGGTFAATLTMLGGLFQYIGALVSLGAAVLLAWPLASDLQAKKKLVLEHYIEGMLALALIALAIIFAFFWHPEIPKGWQIGNTSGAGSAGINNGTINNYSASTGGQEKISLLGECIPTTLPIVIPANSILHLLPLNEQRIKPEIYGFSDIENDGDKASQWPPKAVYRRLTPEQVITGMANKCAISNLGHANLANVSIRLAINFGKGKFPYSYMVVASPVDVGKDFTFYVVSQCAKSVVTALLPDTVKVKISPGDNWKVAKLGHHYNNPLEAMGLLFLMAPAVDWSSGTPCAKIQKP